MNTVRIYERDGQMHLASANYPMRTKRYSWHVKGGPQAAEIEVEGIESARFEVFEWLRCGVEIYDAQMQAVWWGFVNEVIVRTGNLRVTASLEEMYNKIAVVYSYVAPGTSTVGERMTTSWTSNSDSVAAYGTKELLASISGASTTQAEAIRNRILAEHGTPIIGIEIEENQPGVELRCRGWYETLDWRYYANSGTANTATTTQISNIVTTAGQFLAGTNIATASGINSSQYRKGDNTAKYEIEELLKGGTSDGSQLMAMVDIYKWLQVEAEPSRDAYNTPYIIRADGQLLDRMGNEIDGTNCPVGVWVVMDISLPAIECSPVEKDAQMVFIEEAEYDCEQARYIPKARKTKSVWEIASQVVIG